MTRDLKRNRSLSKKKTDRKAQDVTCDVCAHHQRHGEFARQVTPYFRVLVGDFPLLQEPDLHPLLAQRCALLLEERG